MATVTIDQLLANTKTAQKQYQFPTTTNDIHNFPAGEVVEFANGTRPILHDDIVQLIENFIAIKQKTGTDKGE